MIDNELELLKKISEWPDWKIQALCLDESDLVIKRIIEEFKQNNKLVIKQP